VALEITTRELSWLLEGLDITQIKGHQAANFSVF
jgi:hypothetical protein